MKTVSVKAASKTVGFSIHIGESKIIIYNTEDINPITFDREALKEVEA